MINNSAFSYFEEIELEMRAVQRPDLDQVLAGTDRVRSLVFVDERRMWPVGFSR